MIEEKKPATKEEVMNKIDLIFKDEIDMKQVNNESIYNALITAFNNNDSIKLFLSDKKSPDDIDKESVKKITMELLNTTPGEDTNYEPSKYVREGLEDYEKSHQHYVEASGRKYIEAKEKAKEAKEAMLSKIGGRRRNSRRKSKKKSNRRRRRKSAKKSRKSRKGRKSRRKTAKKSRKNRRRRR